MSSGITRREFLEEYYGQAVPEGDAPEAAPQGSMMQGFASQPDDAPDEVREPEEETEVDPTEDEPPFDDPDSDDVEESE